MNNKTELNHMNALPPPPPPWSLFPRMLQNGSSFTSTNRHALSIGLLPRCATILKIICMRLKYIVYA